MGDWNDFWDDPVGYVSDTIEDVGNWVEDNAEWLLPLTFLDPMTMISTFGATAAATGTTLGVSALPTKAAAEIYGTAEGGKDPNDFARQEAAQNAEAAQRTQPTRP